MLSLQNHVPLLSDPEVARHTERLVTSSLKSVSMTTTTPLPLDNLGLTVLRQALGVFALVVKHGVPDLIRPMVHNGIIEKLVKIYEGTPDRIRVNAITAIAHFFIYHPVICKERDMASAPFRDKLLQGFAHPLYRLRCSYLSCPAQLFPLYI